MAFKSCRGEAGTCARLAALFCCFLEGAFEVVFFLDLDLAFGVIFAIVLSIIKTD